MAFGSLLALLDDITVILDDVALLTKVAAKKTAGVLGDDLALNAQQVAGVDASRELPVVWAVAKGSFVNKAILVPAALAIGSFAPWAVTPLLMVGGAFLCYEGVEKLAHVVLHRAEHAAQRAQLTSALADPAVDLVTLERDKIKGAVRTDFILSAEIIAITLATVAASPFGTRLAVLVVVAVVMTAGVYGLVAGIVKLDDGGLYLARRPGSGAWPRLLRSVGAALLTAAPWLMKLLSIAGTLAMFLVGGGILVHGIPPLNRWIETLAQQVQASSGIAGALLPTLLAGVLGVAAGALVLAAVALLRRLLGATRRDSLAGRSSAPAQLTQRAHE